MFKQVKCPCGKRACYNYPDKLLGIKCTKCADKTMVNVQISQASTRFQLVIEKMGGEVKGKYVNSHTQVKCICSKGHECQVYPTSVNNNGQGMCVTCAGKDSDITKQRFIASIEKLGGKIVGEYVRNTKNVECICSKGHICNPKPSHIYQGYKLCIICSI